MIFILAKKYCLQHVFLTAVNFPSMQKRNGYDVVIFFTEI